MYLADNRALVSHTLPNSEGDVIHVQHANAISRCSSLAVDTDGVCQLCFGERQQVRPHAHARRTALVLEIALRLVQDGVVQDRLFLGSAWERES